MLCFPSDKSPSLRQLNNKSQELELPLLRQNGDEREDSAADEYYDDDEEQEITLHWPETCGNVWDTLPGPPQPSSDHVFRNHHRLYTTSGHDISLFFLFRQASERMLTHAGVNKVWFMGERKGDESFKGGYSPWILVGYFSLTDTDRCCFSQVQALARISISSLCLVHRCTCLYMTLMAFCGVLHDKCRNYLMRIQVSGLGNKLEFRVGTILQLQVKLFSAGIGSLTPKDRTSLSYFM